ncbi:MAG: hypothetical protein AAGF82_17515, partial [Pseudomonadota bacterium]
IPAKAGNQSPLVSPAMSFASHMEHRILVLPLTRQTGTTISQYPFHCTTSSQADYRRDIVILLSTMPVLAQTQEKDHQTPLSTPA